MVRKVQLIQEDPIQIDEEEIRFMQEKKRREATRRERL